MTRNILYLICILKIIIQLITYNEIQYQMFELYLKTINYLKTTLIKF